jgi:hypothetical protein
MKPHYRLQRMTGDQLMQGACTGCAFAGPNHKPTKDCYRRTTMCSTKELRVFVQGMHYGSAPSTS